jgi:hypothetical protein
MRQIPTSPKKRCGSLEDKIIYLANISWWNQIYDEIAQESKTESHIN